MALKNFIQSFIFVKNSEKNKMQQKNNYIFTENQYDVAPELLNVNPLCVGCSGGGGHNTAMLAMLQYFKKMGIRVTSHLAKMYQRTKMDTLQAQKIALGVYLLSKGVAAQLTKLTFLPQLPTQDEIIEEIKTLNEQRHQLPKNANQQPVNDSIDMMLDVYPTGYINAAIWNILQRKDRVDDLKKLIAFQMDSDDDNYFFVKKFFLKELEEAQLSLNNKKPYTEIICTQAMALPALCDAVFEHNAKYHTNIKIKQYITDIASSGAIHFFKPLAKLTLAQRQQIKLYGVGLKKYLESKHELHGFAAYVDIKPEKNPMVREGFVDFQKFKNIYFDQVTQLEIKEKNKIIPIKIGANEKVAAIMLGSQTGSATVDYVKSLMHTHDKIFIFGGKRKEIDFQIQQIIDSAPKDFKETLRSKLVLLENQSDTEIGPIMYRSNTIVTRGGGLSVMELMALHANFPTELTHKKSIFVHHTESGKIDLSAGIEWEDRNAETLIEFVCARGICAAKTSTQRFSEQLKGENQLRQEFCAELDAYIAKKRNEEKNRKYFSKQTVINLIPVFSYHTDLARIKAAFKMRMAMHKPQNFSADEIHALKSGDLHRIVEHYEKLNLLPTCFIQARDSHKHHSLLMQRH